MNGCTIWLARIKCRLYRMENALDRSLHDIGFGRDCSGWMEEWAAEAKGLASGDESLSQIFFGHYHAERMIATVSDENVPSWKLAERAGFTLTDKRMYKNLNDDIEELYRFYVMEKGNCRPA